MLCFSTTPAAAFFIFTSYYQLRQFATKEAPLAPQNNSQSGLVSDRVV
jgi:hypothetical protein